MKKRTSDPITYVMAERESETPKYRISNEKISEFLNKKLGFEGKHIICYICEDPDIETWYVVRNELNICSRCEYKSIEIEKKRLEYIEMGLLENDIKLDDTTA